MNITNFCPKRSYEFAGIMNGAPCHNDRKMIQQKQFKKGQFQIDLLQKNSILALCIAQSTALFQLPNQLTIRGIHLVVNFPI